MKATKVKYEKTFNLGNYQNEVIGVEIELADGETAKDAIEKAKKYVNTIQEITSDKEKWQKIVDNPDGYLYSEVKEAQQRLATPILDLPF